MKIRMLLLLFSLSLVALSAGQPGPAPVLYGVGWSQEDPQVYQLHRLDRDSGEAFPLFEIGGESCQGLMQVPGVGLVTNCLQNGQAILVRIDPEAETSEVVTEMFDANPIEGPSVILSFLDMALRPSDSALFGVGSNFIDLGTIPPGPDVFIYRMDLASGLATRVRSLQLAAGIDFRPGTDQLYSVLDGDLVVFDPLTDGLQKVVTLEAAPQFGYDVLAFHPNGVDLFAISAAAGSSSAFSRIDALTGQVQTLGTFPFRMTGLLWSGGESVIEQLVLPIVTGDRFSSGQQIVTTISVFNTASPSVLAQSNTTASPSVEFFDADGNAVPLDQVVCSPAPSPLPLEPGQSLRWQTLSSGFSGWARVRWPNDSRAPRVLGEIAIVDTPLDSCDLRTDRLASRDIRAQVRLSAMEESRESSIPVSITPQRETAVSIVNPSETETALVELYALRDNGSILDTNEFEVPPLGRVSDVLFRLLNRGRVFIVPPVPPEDYRGQLKIVSDLPIASSAIDVLYREGRWGSVPVYQEGAERSP